MKYYAVKNGRTIGIYQTWDECKAQVHGYAGAQYKSFKTREEALLYIGGDDVRVICTADQKKASGGRTRSTGKALIKPDEKEKSTLQRARMVVRGEAEPDVLCGLAHKTMAAYVDGSYHAKNRTYSCGVVLLENGATNLYREVGDDPEMAAMRNVAGEIMGAEYAMRYAAKHGYHTLVLYYDYAGIEKWALGEWKRNKEGTIAYKHAYDALCSQLRVDFQKVDAHTGVLFNELADLLAKDALGIEI